MYKGAAGSRVAQDVRTQRGVGFRRGGAADRAGGNRGICSKLYFARENSARAPLIHYEEDKIRCLATYLEAKAAALQGHHGGRAPAPPEIWALATGHSAPPITSANNVAGIQVGPEANHAIALIA